MSAEKSMANNEMPKTTPTETDNTKPNSLDLTISNFIGNANYNNAIEISQSQHVDAETDAPLTSRDVLYTEACKQMSNYAKCYLRGNLPILRHVLNKLNALPQKSVALQTKMIEVQSVLAQIESFDFNAEHVHEDELYAIVREIGKVEDDYVAMRGKLQFKADIDILQQMLTEVGFEAKEERLTVARRKLVQNFANAFDNFMTTINEVERATEWELVEFYERFRAVTDFEEQYKCFDQFWQIFW